LDGGLIRQNIFFTLGMQTSQQKEMMIEHAHQGNVVVDAPLEQTRKKNDTLCLIIHACGLIHWYICNLMPLKH
jgi:hypothetical protein